MSNKSKIMETAYKIADEQGFAKLLRDDVAEAAECATGSVSYHFGTMQSLKDEVVARAIQQENLAILSAALADGNTVAKGAPESMKRAALELLL